MTPQSLKEAAYGVGATQWEVVWDVVLPWSRPGVIGGIMLGLGRALGETMAVTFVVGNAHRISTSLLAPGTTISAAIANEFAEAVGELYTSSLDGARLDSVRSDVRRHRRRPAAADAARAQRAEGPDDRRALQRRRLMSAHRARGLARSRRSRDSPCLARSCGR